MCSHWLKFKKSCCQKPPSQLNCDIAEMIIGWSCTKLVNRWRLEIQDGRHDIAEILLRVALNTKKSNQNRQLMNLKVEGLLLDIKPTDGSSAY